MNPEQIEQFKQRARALGKSEAEINSYIQNKVGQTRGISPSTTSVQPFTPKANQGLTFDQGPQASKSPQTAPAIVGEVGKGFLKGIGSTLSNLANTGQRALDAVARPVHNAIFDDDYKRVQTTQETFGEALKPTNTAQKVGFYGEQVAEFFLPTSAIGKLGKTIDVATDGLKVANSAKTAIKLAGRVGTEAAATGAIRFGQTGDKKEALTAGATAGAFTGVANVVGKAFKAAKLPEWFYSKVFKNSYDDMLDELKTIGTANLKKNNPELFERLVNSGTIKLRDGKVIINETLAKEALDRGLKGSLKNMANQVVKDTYELEDAARMLTRTHTAPIKVEQQYITLLKEVADDYKVVGFGEVSKEADEILKLINQGTTEADNALRLRRFLDGMRIRSSYNPTAKLSQTQQNFKYLADTMRSRLAKEVRGLKPVMNEYRFNIEAIEALAREAARRNNREALGLLDTVLFGSGVAAGSPLAGAAIGSTRKLLTTPTAVTSIGQKINRVGDKALSGKVRAGAALGSNAIRRNLPQRQQQQGE